MNKYTETILKRYIAKNDLRAEIEADIAEGKLPVVTGNMLIRYVMELPDRDAMEIVEEAKRQGEMMALVEDALIPAAAAIGTAFRKLRDIGTGACNE
jgi:hypothetical protein